MAGWERLQETVRLELQQRIEEGCRPGSLAEKLAAAGSDEGKLMEVYRELMALQVAADFLTRSPRIWRRSDGCAPEVRVSLR